MSRQSHIRLLIAAVAIASLAWFGRSSRGVEPVGVQIAQREAVESPPPEPVAVAFDHKRYVGVAGCAAANCHGGDGSRGVLGSEYSIWIQDDPHAKAYTDLFNETSQRMAKALRLDKPAHEAKLCLNCHGPQSDPPFDGPVAGHGVLLDGVSCESCHGAASLWLGPHVRRDWKQKSAAEKAEFGFRDTKDLWTRGKVCADCHVGEAGRDVNHDLYAAGHPRLFFELSAFNANLPAHWSRDADRKREGSDTASSFEAKLWALGQVASVEAAVDLLVHRAKAASDDVPAFVRGGDYPHEDTIAVWPELAETGCFACHHELSQPSWRQLRGYAGRKPGHSPWQSWLTPLVGDVSSQFSDGGNPLGSLAAEMAKPYPDRATVVSTAMEAQRQLEELGATINDQKLSRDQVTSLLSTVAQNGPELAAQNWDSATQTYLALVALHQGLQDVAGNGNGVPDAKGREVNRTLEELLGQLAFPEGTDSPRSFNTDSMQRLQEQLRAIQQSLNAE
ncbi:MAG: multiheme c-type cytochrome [Planctomycetota bacterium]|jgi:hypothetical protein